MAFSKVRYAQKTKEGVIYRNLNSFAQENPDNSDFIRKYLTLTKCDLFFADKAILVEGASEEMKDYVSSKVRTTFQIKEIRDKIFGHHSIEDGIEALYEKCYSVLEEM